MAQVSFRLIDFRRLRREQQIVSTLMRHGLGWLVTSLGIGAAIPFHWGLLGHPRREERYSAAEHLRMAFEELGPTFIKLAQILSTRPDLISPEYARELSKLQDHVPAIGFTDMKTLLEEELQAPYEDVFAELEFDAIGSASIAQVYRAKLHTGECVVVKIQRPGVREAIAIDLEILERFARRMARKTEWGQRYDLVGFLHEFAFSLTNELDYVYEGQNADRIRSIHEDDERIFIPRIYWDHTTPRVLVMDEIRGVKIMELDTTKHLAAQDRRHLAEAATEITMAQVFEAGFFHADPHPGNFVIMKDKRIGLMDFGLVGSLDDAYQDNFLRFTYYMVRHDTEGMLDALWDLGITEEEARRPAIQRDLNHLLYRFSDSSFGELAAGDMLGELMSLAYRHRLRFPANLTLLFKVLSMNEGVAAMIDPEFRFFEFIEPRLQELWKQRYSPSTITRKVETDAMHLAQLLQGLPHRTSRLIQRLELGDLQFTVRHVGLEREGERIYTAINRLTVGLLLGLFILGLGLYILAGHFAGFGSGLVRTMLVLILISAASIFITALNIWRHRNP